MTTKVRGAYGPSEAIRGIITLYIKEIDSGMIYLCRCSVSHVHFSHAVHLWSIRGRFCRVLSTGDDVDRKSGEKRLKTESVTSQNSLAGYRWLIARPLPTD